MKLLSFSILLIVTSPTLTLGQQSLPTLKELLTNQEFKQYQKLSNYKNQINFFRKAFETRGHRLRIFVKRNKEKEINDVLYQLRFLPQHVEKESNNQIEQKNLRRKEVKRLEISLRKLVNNIQDLKSLPNIKNYKQFDLTTQSLENLRKILLKQILGDFLAKHELNSPEPNLYPNFTYKVIQPVIKLNIQSRGREWVSDDRFTQVEYRGIQENQTLEKRVTIFLEIANSRLNEIQRRHLKIKWDGENINYLESHTYRDMLHAYLSSLKSMMINIDEKAINKSASPDELRNSLKEVSEKTEHFPSQLESIKKLAIELQDIDLHKKITQAQETTTIVQKGAQYGLKLLEQ